MRKLVVVTALVVLAAAAVLLTRDRAPDSPLEELAQEADMPGERDGAAGGFGVSGGTPADTGRTTPGGATDAEGGLGSPADSSENPTPPAAEEGPAPVPRAEPDEAPAADADPARTVLARAAAAYDRVRSLRAEFVQTVENPILRRTTTSRGVLAQRSPDRFLMDFSDPEGDRVVSDGEHLWVYYPSVDPEQVMRLPAARGPGGMDLKAQFLGDPQRRFRPELVGTEDVGGRTTDVLVLTPAEEVGYRRLTVWVDREDGLARRFEIVEDNGTVRRFDLSALSVNEPLPDDLFHFRPPAGARVVERG